ncbi:MAG: GNAT family N-acetyltransferase [Proteobacteria bacterium]|nr:GNAT family N-acetyltransferase [Pseudomonadota bacterium]
MVRELVAADTAEACKLLRERPLHNVFLDHVISSGILGRAPGFYGFAPRGRLEAILMIGPLGGTILEARAEDAYEPLAECAAAARPRPRHIVGCEEVTRPFFRAYSRRAPEVIWERREHYYVISARDRDGQDPRSEAEIEQATQRDFEATLANSARQHREDLNDDRYGADPEGFRRRHLRDLQNGRWWVLRERGEVVFQVHVGAENRQLVQLGGVITVPEARSRGLATRGMQAIVEHLLARRPAVGLFCNVANRTACGVYERVGFQRAFDYRSWLLDEPLEPEREATYA